MAREADILLPDRQRQAGGDAQLLAHQIDARDHLGDTVLHLDARVHLHEVEVLARPVEQELDRARALVAHGLRRAHGGLTHRLTHGVAQAPGGRLLDQLLIAALDGAVAVAQVHDVAMPVRQHLHLDVPGTQHQLFQIQLVVAKAGHGLGLRLLIGALQLRIVVAAPDAAPAAARARLEQHGIAHLTRG